MSFSVVFIAEVLGACAVVINFIGYRQNQVNHYRLVSAIALAFVSVHFFMLDAMAAGVACGTASIRNVIAMRWRHMWIVQFFVLINLAFFAYEWWWLDHGWLILFAYTSSIIFTVGSILLTSTHAIRRWFLLAEGLGLVYVVASGSIFGTVFTASNMLSIVVKMAQDRQAEKQAQR